MRPERPEHPERTDRAAVEVAQPCIKCAGGKRQLLPEILPRLPKKIGTYFEPFVGGGAVFFALAAEGRFARAALGDANGELIHTYSALPNSIDAIVRALKRHKHDEKHYYAVRALRTRTLSSSARAARFIYLNKTCFNGLWRVNRRGRFNVPFGRYTNPTICDEKNLRAVAEVFRPVHFSMHDFTATVADAERGDAVYMDPPYCPVSTTSNFTSYTRDGFTLDDQRRLAECARALKKRGVHVLLSNADVPIVRKLYKGFELHRVSARRNINSKGEKRGNVGELLIVGSPSR